MGIKYHHLTEQDRIFLRILLEKRYSKLKIANILGVHRSTIYREIKRNSDIHYTSRKAYYPGGWFAHKEYLGVESEERSYQKMLSLGDMFMVNSVQVGLFGR